MVLKDEILQEQFGWLACWIVDRWMDSWMDGWMDGPMDGRMDGWMDGELMFLLIKTFDENFTL